MSHNASQEAAMTRRAKSGEAKETTINVRVTRDLRDRLEAAAAVAGRSLAQEVEGRLEQSLRDNPPGRAPWSDVTWYHARIVGLSLHHIEQMAGRRWIETKALCEAAKATVAQVFKDAHPPGADAEPMTPEELEEAKRLSAAGKASADFLTYRTSFSQYEQATPGPILNKLMRASGSE